MVEFALVGENVRVRACRSNQVVVADALADPRPRHSGQMEERDAAVAEIVR